MKRAIAVLLALLLVSSLSSAQLSFGGGAQAGLSFSSFPKIPGVESPYGMGFGFGGHGDLNIMKYIGLRLNVDYHMFPIDKAKITDAVARANGVAPGDLSFSGLTVGILGITVNGLGKLPLAGPVTPYGIIGLGLHMISTSDPKLTYQGQDRTREGGFGPVEGKTKFGLNFGAGAEFKLGSIKLYADIKYVLVFTENESSGHIPFTVGVTL
jgi:opacity protein-like surface antigen